MMTVSEKGILHGQANRSADGVEWFSAPDWSKYDWLWHGFSTRRGGVSTAYLADGLDGSDASGIAELNLGFTAADPRESVLENRRLFAQALSGSRETPLRALRQIHCNRSITAPSSADAEPVEADGIMTTQPGSLLGIQTADCIPVLVVDPVKRAVAGFHAGWRGTVKSIVERGVGRMAVEFGSKPEDMIAAIGPGIGSCCYTVGGEVEGRFAANFTYAEELFERCGEDLFLDLIEANRRQLLAAGLAAESISIVGGCTACYPELFFSHRASGGNTGRMMAAIGIR
ncbi:MAG TPA: peptidoglycan editing factor PgeF [Acidobacteriaceae bacterium]|jgi:hypothetical protein|nr:peptidoglycan editing factor PgeF [Acidobacteriaceae bacterium]